MADDQDDELLGEEQINLIDMHTNLIDIQATVRNMSKEHTKLATEVMELKTSFKRQETHIDNMKKTLDTAINSNEYLQRKTE